MTREEFWSVVETARLATNNDPDAQSKAIEAHLQTLPDDELIAFHSHFSALYAPTYRADLWGAAYVINGGCSDDGFDYFRAWLIGRGQVAYEAALASPIPWRISLRTTVRSKKAYSQSLSVSGSSATARTGAILERTTPSPTRPTPTSATSSGTKTTKKASPVCIHGSLKSSGRNPLY